MATIYSGYSSVWQPSGGSKKQYRSWLTYSVTTNADNVVVSAYMGVNINSSVGASYSAQLSATGQTTYTGSGKTEFNSSGSGRTVTIIGTKTYTWPRTTASQTKTVSASVKSSNESWTGQWMTCSASINIPALGAYDVTYDSNGGSGSIEGQTKYYNIDLTPLSDGTGMEWSHHTLTGWNTSADGTGTAYELGGTYSANEAVVLYAQWQLNAIEIKTKVGGEWKDAIIYTKVDGEWVLPFSAYTKVNGEWKQIVRGD